MQLSALRVPSLRVCPVWLGLWLLCGCCGYAAAVTVAVAMAAVAVLAVAMAAPICFRKADLQVFAEHFSYASGCRSC